MGIANKLIVIEADALQIAYKNMNINILKYRYKCVLAGCGYLNLHPINYIINGNGINK
jgi:hypothetical protein